MKKTVLRVVTCMALLSAVGLSACTNTWRGFGADTEHAGQKIQDSADHPNE